MLIRSYEPAIRSEVDGWERNRVLSSSEPDLIAYLVDKYTLDPPRLHRDQIHIEDEGERKIDVSGRFDYGAAYGDGGPHFVPGSYVTVAVPFEGDPDLFEFRASTYTLNPPRGRISAPHLLISFSDVKLEPERLTQEIDRNLDSIEQHLGWITSDCEQWNSRVENIARQCLDTRKGRLLEQADMVSALGIPIRKRADSPGSVSIPVSRKKRPIELPSVPTEAFKPEPALPNEDYDFILDVIDRLALSIERSPSTFVHMNEEQIRDFILVSLNGHYEGDATGETFNSEGKTDILIRANGKNAFIAECKIWQGPRAFHSAIDQVLGYLTWRDTKAAVVVFSKNADFTNVLTSIASTVPEHTHFKQELRRISDTHVRYLFRQKADPARDLYLAVQVFNIPRPSAS